MQQRKLAILKRETRWFLPFEEGTICTRTLRARGQTTPIDEAQFRLEFSWMPKEQDAYRSRQFVDIYVPESAVHTRQVLERLMEEWEGEERTTEVKTSGLG